MRDRKLHARSFEWLCACLILAPCAALAQQNGTAPKATAAPADSAAHSAPQPPAGADASGAAPSATPSATQADAASAASATGASQKQADDPEPAVDTSDNAARAKAESARNTKQEPRGASGKAMDHLDLGTTDITGNRELPKVMYIVPWKRSDLGDLTGKPLNSLVDQTLEPVDRNVFERSNRYYGAVTAGASTAGAPPTGGTPSGGAPGAGAPNAPATNAGASQDAHRTPGAASGSAARDER